jgi:hypothetical protein
MIMLGIRDVTLAESKISMSVETVNTPEQVDDDVVLSGLVTSIVLGWVGV